MTRCPTCGHPIASDIHIFDPEERTVRAGGQLRPLTATQWVMLSYLRKNEGHFVRMMDLFEEMYRGAKHPRVEVNAVTTHMGRLRHALAGSGYRIVGRTGLGYKLEQVA